jgi:histidine triad (HIT) family protein
MSTIFTRIIAGEITCHKLYEDENYLSFLDVRPINPGHALVIPKIENDYIFDLEDEVLAGLMIAAKPIAKAIEQVVDCKRIGLMVAGLEVPHTHVHMVPINGVGDLNFSLAKETASEELAALAEKIRSALS